MRNLIKNLLASKEFRFLITGGINTIVGYGSYTLFIFLGIQYLIANIFSTIIGTINSYFLNKYFTFKSPKKSFAEVIRFCTVYLISFLIGLISIYFLVDIININSYIAGFINLIFTTLISYFGHNWFSFKK